MVKDEVNNIIYKTFTKCIGNYNSVFTYNEDTEEYNVRIKNSDDFQNIIDREYFIYYPNFEAIDFFKLHNIIDKIFRQVVEILEYNLLLKGFKNSQTLHITYEHSTVYDTFEYIYFLLK